jgi:hypothetical protein
MSPEDEALARQAGQAESSAANEALAQWLQGRVVSLHMEVLRRDQRIAELEAERATWQGDAFNDVSGAEGPTQPQ